MFDEGKRIALTVRLPQELGDEIKRRAKENRRSVNQEIVWLLEKALELLGEQERGGGQ